MELQKSYLAKPGELEKRWFIFDAQHQILGRMAVDIATILMGKHTPNYTPHVDTGDFVIVVNAEKIEVTGRKLDNKIYYAWSGYPGGLRKKNLRSMIAQHPERAIMLAVRRMLPKTTMGNNMLKKLKIYSGSKHPHAAQNPQVWKNFQESLKKEAAKA